MKGAIMTAIIVSSALGLGLILGSGVAYSQMSNSSSAFNPLEQQQAPINKPLDLPQGQTTQGEKGQFPTTRSNFPQTTMPMTSNKPLDQPQAVGVQSVQGKSFSGNSSRNPLGKEGLKTNRNRPKPGSTRTRDAAIPSAAPSQTLLSGFGQSKGTPGATALSPFSAYLHDNKIGTCFEKSLEPGSVSRKKTARREDNTGLTRTKKPTKAEQWGWGLSEKPHKND